jgi:hypothetical protein
MVPPPLPLPRHASCFADEVSLSNDPLFALFQIGEEIDSEDCNPNKPIASGVSTETTNQSLGPVLEEALLTALCALGVLHSSHDQVLTLPCDQELFRGVILERYIKAKGGTTEEWHTKLIRFFEKKSNSHRRCEELPWHLKICRKWYTLKADVAHLDTFHTMLHVRFPVLFPHCLFRLFSCLISLVG